MRSALSRPALALLAAFVSTSALAHAQGAPFRFSGPLPGLLAPGVSAAPNGSGLPFEIKISGGGKTITGTSFDLAVPGAGKPFRLALTGAAWSGGKLTATATVTNGTGAALEGLRLDLVGASETYTAKDAEGKPKTLQRAQSPQAAPLHFGDLGPGEASDPLPLAVSALTFAPETVDLTVRGVVSGLRYESLLHNPQGCSGGEVDVDGGGNLYLADTCGQRIARLTAAGQVSTAVAFPEQQAKGSARDAKSGRLAATYTNDPNVHLYGTDGKEAMTIGEEQGIDSYSDSLRYDPQGRLWGTVGASLARFAATGKIEARWRTVGGSDIAAGARFDVAADGTVWIVNEGNLWRVSADGKKQTKLAAPGARPGELAAAQSVRLAADGSVWVTEGADFNLGSAERVSVFDPQGRLLRVFGRGAKAPLPDYPDRYHDAQLHLGNDLAFGAEGRVYITCSRPAENGEYVMVFRRF